MVTIPRKTSPTKVERSDRATREAFSKVTVVRTAREMRGLSRRLARTGSRITLVPTMGYLHEGHLSLIDRAREFSEQVCVSIFVNPAQFGPGEDLERYPRDVERDLALAEARGATIAFVPAVEEVYPEPQCVWVDPGPLADRLCGRSRPGHFRGVLTVVLKLFQIVEPHAAVFGRKDLQQAALIRIMCRDFSLPTRIEVCPIVREPDGLALSSRNVYLSSDDRRRALSLSQSLRAVRESFAAGETDPAELVATASRVIEDGGMVLDYATIVDPASLIEPSEAGAGSICAVAAMVGGTRLIDNSPLAGLTDL